MIVGKTNLPEFGILPVTEADPARPDPQSVGPGAHARRLVRRRGGRGRGRHGADRARQRRRRLDPHPGGVLRAGRAEAQPRPRLAGPEPGETYLVQDGVLTRTRGRHGRRARRARGLRAGRRYWAPPPAEPFAAAAGRDPGRLRVGVHDDPADRRPIDPIVPPRRGRGGRSCSRRSATRWRRRAALDRPGLLRCSPPPSARSSPASSSAALVAAGHRRTTSSRSRGTSTSSAGRERARVPGRRWRSWSALVRDQMPLYERYDVVLTPALAERPVPHRGDRPRGPDRRHLRALRRVHPVHGDANVTGQPAISVPLYHGDDGLPTGVQLIGQPAGEDDAALARRATRDRAAVGGAPAGASAPRGLTADLDPRHPQG